MIKWDVTPEEAKLIDQIADRAVNMEAGISYQMQDAAMDLTACHRNGCELDLERLLNAEPGEFGHDVFGIRLNLNRRTGKLENHFWPRFARKQ